MNISAFFKVFPSQSKHRQKGLSPPIKYLRNRNKTFPFKSEVWTMEIAKIISGELSNLSSHDSLVLSLSASALLSVVP